MYLIPGNILNRDKIVLGAYAVRNKELANPGNPGN